MRRTFWITVFLFAAVATPGRAQELGELIEDVGRAYSEPYLQPMVNALGVDMNTGLFHSASVGGGLLPLVDVYVGAKVMGAFVPDADRTLSLVYQTERTIEWHDGNEYTVPLSVNIDEAPTVFGDESPGVATVPIDYLHPGPDNVEGTADDVPIDTTLSFEVLPGLIETPIVPFIVPQIGLGSFMGTDLTIRYLPKIGFQDYGSVGFTGIGVRHSISQYIPLFPISLSAQVMWQKLSIDDVDDNEIFSASALAGNVVASKSLLVLTVYGGLQVERSSVDIEYTFDPEVEGVSPQQIEFGLTGDNNFRAVAGLALNLGPMLVNVDAGVGNTTVVSGGVGISL